MASPATLPSGTESLNDKLAGHCNTASLQEYPNIVHALDCLKMILDRERSRQRHGESPTSEPVIFTIEESPQAKDRRRSLRERADHVLAASEGAEVLPIDIESTGSLVQVRECMKEIVDQLRVLLPDINDFTHSVCVVRAERVSDFLQFKTSDAYVIAVTESCWEAYGRAVGVVIEPYQVLRVLEPGFCVIYPTEMAVVLARRSENEGASDKGSNATTTS